MAYQFQKAVPVWIQNADEEWNEFCSFFGEVSAGRPDKITIAISAHDTYRLYINGQFTAAGPVRAAKGYARVDEIVVEAEGNTCIAVEVTAQDNPLHYSNDSTLEKGMFTCEVKDSKGRVLAWTGRDFIGRKLSCRRSRVERISHCRGIIEWYDLNPQSESWMMGGGSDWTEPQRSAGDGEKDICFLARRAPYPDYHPIEMPVFCGASDVVPGQMELANRKTVLTEMVHKEYYAVIPEENRCLGHILAEDTTLFTGSFQEDSDGFISLIPGKHPAALDFERNSSEVGYIAVDVTAEETCRLDVLHTDHLEKDGRFIPSTSIARYDLEPGTYHLIGSLPGLIRYIRLVFDTRGTIRLKHPVILDSTYPDAGKTFFSCSDGDLNRIYEASRRTLRLCTADIFMDCPERERGGWLCDSFFISQAAWQMFGDLSVEKDFLENFLLTDGTKTWKGFFPEVYPSSKKSEENVGIISWSLWLAEELYAYYLRSGDRDFLDLHRHRVVQFVDGLLSLRGAGGLIETDQTQFVDWSLSNEKENLYPISIPNNCLACDALEKLAKLYGVEEWKNAAREMRSLIEKLPSLRGGFAPCGDGAVYENGKLRRSGIRTEAGIALELFSGAYADNEECKAAFADSMGYAPIERSDPNIAKPNLFIGLILRFAVLAAEMENEKLIHELKSLYLPQLQEGSGTLYEGYAEHAGCHGMNGQAGVLITNHVLGLGEPMELSKKVVISPYPGTVSWARGTARCSDGMISMQWNANRRKRRLGINLLIPDGWHYELNLPDDLKSWTVEINGEKV